MKRFIPKITLALCLALVVVVISGHVTYADAAPTTGLFGLFDLTKFVAEVLANLFYTLQTIASWGIALAGTLLNWSINLTLNIHQFVNDTPAIFSIWKAIRDISGMFIIFALIWASLELILSPVTSSPKFGDLIKNIIVAGVVINFSFFVAGVGIDASNIISVQLYNAIAPANSLNPASLNPGNIKATLADGGLSDIFMKSLGITSLYDSGSSLSDQSIKGQSGWSLPLQVIIRGVTSIIIMVTAALSFFFAAIAFIIRFIILILLLAFSPIWFASHIVPRIGDQAKEWTGAYTANLIFMPVYLLLMYFALSVLTSNTYLNGAMNQISALQSSNQSEYLLAMILNSVLVIVLINAPLLAAIKIGGAATSWFDSKKYGAMGVSKWIGGFAGRNTAGRAAASFQSSGAMKGIYKFNPTVGRIVSNTTKKVSGSTYGGAKGSSYDDITKKEAEEHQKLAATLALSDEDVNKELKRQIDNDPKLAKHYAEINREKAKLKAMGNPENDAEVVSMLQNAKALKTKAADEDATIQKLRNDIAVENANIANGTGYDSQPEIQNIKLKIQSLEKQKTPGPTSSITNALIEEQKNKLKQKTVQLAEDKKRNIEEALRNRTITLNQENADITQRKNELETAAKEKLAELKEQQDEQRRRSNQVITNLTNSKDKIINTINSSENKDKIKNKEAYDLAEGFKNQGIFWGRTRGKAIAKAMRGKTKDAQLLDDIKKYAETNAPKPPAPPAPPSSPTP
ncbi:MAG: hypothetical protein WCG07_00390 [Candidatus Taylorbacteria bacterium]